MCRKRKQTVPSSEPLSGKEDANKRKKITQTPNKPKDTKKDIITKDIPSTSTTTAVTPVKIKSENIENSTLTNNKPVDSVDNKEECVNMQESIIPNPKEHLDDSSKYLKKNIIRSKSEELIEASPEPLEQRSKSEEPVTKSVEEKKSMENADKKQKNLMFKRNVLWKMMTKKIGHENKRRCNSCGALFSSKTSTSVLHGHLDRNHWKEYNEKIEEERNKYEQAVRILSGSSEDEAEKLTKLLIKTIVSSSSSPELVKNVHFRAFIMTACPSYEMPSPTTIRRKIKEMSREIATENLKNLIEYRWVLTSDAWTSQNGSITVVTILVFFVDKQFERRYKLIGLKRVEGRHTAINLTNAYRKALTTNDDVVDDLILNNAFVGLSDGAYNARASIRNLGIDSLRCSAHAIQLIVVKVCSVAILKNAITKGRNIVKMLHKSDVLRGKFESVCNELGVKNRKIRSFSLTRWMASCMLLRDCIEFEKVIDKMEEFKEYVFDEQEQVAVKFFLRFGGLLEKKLALLESNRGYASEIISNFYNIHCKITSSVEFRNADAPNHQIAVIMKTETDLRLNEFLQSQTTVISSFFDHRSWNSSFLPPMDYAQKKLEFVNIFAKILENEDEANESESDQSDPEEDDDWTADMYAAAVGVSTLEHKLINEYNKYENQLMTSRNTKTDPLLFWKVHQHMYPKLAILAKLYLSIPSSSSDSERIFSKAGDLLCNKKKCSMSSSTLEQNIMISLDGLEEVKRIASLLKTEPSDGDTDQNVLFMDNCFMRDFVSDEEGEDDLDESIDDNS